MGGAHLADAFKGGNPNRLVPVLEEPDGFRVVESSALLKYLAEKTGPPASGPTRAGQRADRPVQQRLPPGLRLRPGLSADPALPCPEGPAMQSAVLARGAERPAQLMRMLNDHRLGGAGPTAKAPTATWRPGRTSASPASAR
jgi:glutathione S-transferase